MELKEKILENLKRVMDPELNVNVVDLGLIYNIEFPKEGTLKITMTLTTPGCPLHDSITNGVRFCLLEMEGISDVDVNIVWQPAWTPDKMTPEGLRLLGR